MAKKCPLLKKACIEHDCQWYTNVMGKHPQTEETINNWGCAVEWLPVLLIENAQQARQTGASIDSFRNEMVKDNQKQLEVYTQRLQHESD